MEEKELDYKITSDEVSTTITVPEKPKPAKPEKEVTVLFVGESKEGLFLKEKESKQVRIAPHGTKINRVHPMKIKENLFIKWSLK